MNMNQINEICNYIIKTVQTNAFLNGFQYYVSFYDIEKQFCVTITSHLSSEILDSLSYREEVADVIIIDDCFDVVLYTDYAPNYS